MDEGSQAGSGSQDQILPTPARPHAWPFDDEISVRVPLGPLAADSPDTTHTTSTHHHHSDNSLMPTSLVGPYPPPTHTVPQTVLTPIVRTHTRSLHTRSLKRVLLLLTYKTILTKLTNHNRIQHTV